MALFLFQITPSDEGTFDSNEATIIFPVLVAIIAAVAAAVALSASRISRCLSLSILQSPSPPTSSSEDKKCDDSPELKNCADFPIPEEWVLPPAWDDETLPEKSTYRLRQAFRDAPFKPTAGLIKLKPADWIDIDCHYESEIKLRKSLLTEKRDLVLRFTPTSYPACHEIMQALIQHLLARFPTIFTSPSVEIIHNNVTGDTFHIPSLLEKGVHPLEVCGWLVQEDLCVMERKQGTDEYNLTAAILAFPGRWSLAEKMGMNMAEIHRPVDFYRPHLEKTVDKLFLKLKDPLYRINWGLTDDSALFQPGGHDRSDPRPDITAENAGNVVFLRTEYQTLRRMAGSGAILFTIKTGVFPLEEMIAVDPSSAKRLAGAIRAMPESTAAYKSIPVVRGPTLAYLDSVAQEAL